jgi:hypothetical protein
LLIVDLYDLHKSHTRAVLAHRQDSTALYRHISMHIAAERDTVSGSLPTQGCIVVCCNRLSADLLSPTRCLSFSYPSSADNSHGIDADIPILLRAGF